MFTLLSWFSFLTNMSAASTQGALTHKDSYVKWYI